MMSSSSACRASSFCRVLSAPMLSKPGSDARSSSGAPAISAASAAISSLRDARRAASASRLFSSRAALPPSSSIATGLSLGGLYTPSPLPASTPVLPGAAASPPRVLAAPPRGTRRSGRGPYAVSSAAPASSSCPSSAAPALPPRLASEAAAVRAARSSLSIWYDMCLSMGRIFSRYARISTSLWMTGWSRTGRPSALSSRYMVMCAAYCSSSRCFASRYDRPPDVASRPPRTSCSSGPSRCRTSSTAPRRSSTSAASSGASAASASASAALSSAPRSLATVSTSTPPAPAPPLCLPPAFLAAASMVSSSSSSSSSMISWMTALMASRVRARVIMCWRS
mmetsp:Transcript_21852/g.55596  ORF Transcript_21852/g.55596 Transcript_21852/m.55596 type:complete len:339 (+) Transcript_21852:1223-2239(+)